MVANGLKQLTTWFAHVEVLRWSAVKWERRGMMADRRSCLEGKVYNESTQVVWYAPGTKHDLLRCVLQAIITIMGARVGSAGL